MVLQDTRDNTFPPSVDFPVLVLHKEWGGGERMNERDIAVISFNTRGRCCCCMLHSCC